MSTDRREFLQRLTVGGIALSMPSALSASVAPHAADLSAARLVHQQPGQAFDVSWPKKLTGKHKAVYDSPDIGSGLGVIRAGVVAAQYMDVFKLPASDISSVIVLRHTGIHLAMIPAYWSQYKIGKMVNATHPMTEKPIDFNPALITEADGVPAMLAGFGLDKQIAKGVIVLGCALAFADVIDTIAKADKLSPADAERKAKTLLMPGVIMQPSGVFATTLAQENGCAYVRAT